jgi:hypothetical protein
MNVCHKCAWKPDSNSAEFGGNDAVGWLADTKAEMSSHQPIIFTD